MAPRIADIDGPFVILDDSRIEQAGPSYLFHSPEDIICVRTLDEVPAALHRLDQAVADGFYAVGWIAYEVGAAFEGRVAAVTHAFAEEPLIWLMLTRKREVLTKTDIDAMVNLPSQSGASSDYHFRFKEGDVNAADYTAAFNQVADYIKAGDVYQVNYTYPRQVWFEGSALGLYAALRKQQPVAYGAFVDTGHNQILSLSPELFFRRVGATIESHPMKGTMRKVPEVDVASHAINQQAKAALATDNKNRAENLMIVDLIRNDLSRIAKQGSVEVSDLYGIEEYPTVYQMTSKVSAECDASLTPSSALKALFPCGSVTGAPKVRAMEIINELEQNPRGIYCGALGFFGPTSRTTSGEQACQTADWVLNVPIRTLVFGNRNVGRLSAGSGIVSDSVARTEFEECETKLAFAQSLEAADNFHLIETMRMEGGAIGRMDAHMRRLAGSAAHFSFDFSRDKIEQLLHELGQEHSDGLFRVRLALYREGRIDLKCVPFEDSQAGQELLVMIAKETVAKEDQYRRHKTSNRGLYDAATMFAQGQGLADIIFLNEFGRVAEGAISTVFIETGHTLYTPPVSEGALPGILRGNLIANRSHRVLEKELSLEDVAAADHIYIGNALRGLRRVTLRDGRVSVRA